VKRRNASPARPAVLRRASAPLAGLLLVLVPAVAFAWPPEMTYPKGGEKPIEPSPSIKVDYPPPKEQVHDFGRTPLMKAVSAGDEAKVRELLDGGADPAAEDAVGSTALFYLPPEGDAAITEELIAAGAPVDAANHVGLTPLCVAATLGRSDVTRVLLVHGADPNVLPPEGEPPLARALREGHLETARLLLEWPDGGAAVNPPLARGTTLIYRQAVAGDAEGVRLLLAHGAPPDPRVGREGINPGETPLLAAARLGHDEVVRALLDAPDKPADVEALDKDGKTPLILAAANAHPTVVRMLLDHGARVGSPGADKTRTSPLAYAAMAGSTEAVQALLDHGADVDVQNHAGVTPLMLAAFGKEPEIVEQLLQAGAQVDLENHDGNTALVYAVLLRRPDAVRMLLDAGASTTIQTSIPDFGYVDPLMLAAGRGHHEVAKALLDHGAKTGVFCQIDSVGRMTPLLMAARAGDDETVRMLLDHGADPSVADDDGKTALDWAREGGHRTTQAILETALLTDPAQYASR